MKPTTTKLLVAGWLGLASACNGPGTQIGSIYPLTSGADASTADSLGCAADTAALGSEMYAGTNAMCAIAVRLDHDTRAIKGYQLFCGGYAALTEPQARTLGQADSGFGATGALMTSDNAYVVFDMHDTPTVPSGMVVVSATAGRTAFGGSMIMGGGSGDITHPTTWRLPNTLSTGCATTGSISRRIGFDPVMGTPLSSADIDAATEVVRATSIPSALLTGGTVFNAIVVRYAPSIEPFNSTIAEWIVVVNGGFTPGV